MTQDELDIQNGITTLSKMCFFNDAKKYHISKEKMIFLFFENNELIHNEIEKILYDKATKYNCNKCNTKTEFIKYLIE